MRVGRLILVVGTLITILVFPLLIRDALQALHLPNAYAAPGTLDPNGRVYQNGNNDDNDNNNDGSGDGDDNEDDGDDNDDDGEDNGNVECYASLNDNETVPCDFEDNGNFDDNFDGAANDNAYIPPPPPPPPPPAPVAGNVPSSRRCFAVQESGDVQLVLEGGSITIRVVSASNFSQNAWIELDDVDPATVPAPPAGSAFLDRLVWRMDGGSPCDGPTAGQLPGDVNLGIPYRVAANKSKLQIVHLQGNQWVEVPTVPDPDPNNPYISATVRNTGVYAVIQKP